MGKEELVAAFQDTLDFSAGLLGETTAKAAASGMIYREGFCSNRMFALEHCRIDLLPCPVAEAAAQYSDLGRIALLNTANPHFPGGGVRSGARGQEEDLCCRSNLYHCLVEDRLQEHFYRYHKEKTDYFFSDRVIYTKGVTIFKDGSTVSDLMPAEKWVRVDVISCAAPYIARRRYTNRTVLGEILRRRIRNILETAIDNRAEVLVLSAFGCGPYGNPADVVARAFRQVLLEQRYQGAFRNVVFAIEDSGTLRSFAAALAGDDREQAASMGEITMPGGRVLRGDMERGQYEQWKRGNPWYGKQFSVLGDSISTLDGINPRGYRVFYQGKTCEKTGVREMEDTWWGKVIDFFGGELLVNDAWSGSQVARAAGQGDPFPSGCSPRRTGNLHTGSVMPDVILVYMGVNDWARGVPVTGPDREDTVFGAAYGRMLAQLRRNYPDAEIWCCTISETYMRSNPRFAFPSAYGGIELDEYNGSIQRAARENGCRLLDLHGIGLPYDTVDGTHPTAAGMDTLAVLALRCAAGDAGSAFLDCPGGRHENVELPALERGYRFVCKRCGREYVLPYRDNEKIQLVSSFGPAMELRRKDTGETLCFRGEEIFVGRSADCDLRLYGDYAARYQAEFVFRDGAWHVRDNQSKNGTYLNGARLAFGQEARLHPGDEIAFAKMETVVFCG